MIRVRPTLNTFEDRLNLSPITPVDAIAPAAPQPIVAFEYLVLGAVPTAPRSEPLPVLLVIANRDYYFNETGPASNELTLHGTDVEQASGRRTYEPIYFTKRMDASAP